MARPVITLHQACHRIAAHRQELAALGVTSVKLFGSIAHDELTDASDVDALVEFARPVSAFEFLDVQEYLASILCRSVDLATPAAIKPRMRERVLSEAVRAL